MNRILVCALALAPLLVTAADSPPEPTKPKPEAPLTELERVKYQNIFLRLQMLNQEQQALNASVCGDRKIPLDKCLIDAGSGSVSRAPDVATTVPPQTNAH